MRCSFPSFPCFHSKVKEEGLEIYDHDLTPPVVEAKKSSCSRPYLKTAFAIAGIASAILMLLGILAIAAYHGSHSSSFLSQVNHSTTIFAEKIAMDPLLLAIFMTTLGGFFAIGTFGTLIQKQLSPPKVYTSEPNTQH